MDNQEDFFAKPEFTVGGALRRGFYALFKKPSVFIGLPLFVLLLDAAIQLYLFYRFFGFGREIDEVFASGYLGRDVMVFSFIWRIVEFLLWLMVMGAITFAVYNVLRIGKVSFGKSLGRGLARFLPLLGLTILLGIAAFLLAMLLGYMLEVSGRTMQIIILCALLVVLVILACILFVSVPACVVEKKGVFGCLARSAELTKGNRLSIFFIGLIAMLLTVILRFICQFILVMLTRDFVVITLVSTIIISIPIGFFHVLTATVYYDLRAAKEGVTLDSLASVFD